MPGQGVMLSGGELLILLFFVKDIRSPDVRLLISMSGLSSSEVRPWVRVLVETNDLSAPVYIYC